MILQIPTQRTGPEIVPPTRAHATDAGYDLRASRWHELFPGCWGLVETGLSVAIPEGYCGLILPRSGLALEYGVTVLNSPGLIDSGYRGEVKVALINHGGETIEIHEGDRIAQLVIVKAETAEFHSAVEMPESDRGSNGFGSTGP